jgi:hypothetical protein
LVKNVERVESLLQRCQNNPYSNNVDKLYKQLEDELEFLRENIGELRSLLEFTEKDEERIRLGLTIEEIKNRKGFFTNIQAKYQLLRGDADSLGKKGYETLQISKHGMKIGNPLYNLENHVSLKNEALIYEQGEIYEVGLKCIVISSL